MAINQTKLPISLLREYDEYRTTDQFSVENSEGLEGKVAQFIENPRLTDEDEKVYLTKPLKKSKQSRNHTISDFQIIQLGRRHRNQNNPFTIDDQQLIKLAKHLQPSLSCKDNFITDLVNCGITNDNTRRLLSNGSDNLRAGHANINQVIKSHADYPHKKGKIASQMAAGLEAHLPKNAVTPYYPAHMQKSRLCISSTDKPRIPEQTMKKTLRRTSSGTGEMFQPYRQSLIGFPTRYIQDGRRALSCDARIRI